MNSASVSTSLLDHKKRRIHVSVKPNGKSVFFVKKADGTKAYGNKAMFRKHGSKGKVTKVVRPGTVPVEVRSISMLPRNEAIMHVLVMQHKRLFDMFGRVILAKTKGYDYKVKNYKKNIREFLRAADKSLKVSENNRKRDIKILMKQVMVLKEHAKML
jgi:hypothetical protein